MPGFRWGGTIIRPTDLANFVAVSNTGSGVAAVSSIDGITWTPRTLPAATQHFSVAYGNSTWAVMSQASSTAACTSGDGINFAARTVPLSQYRGVAFGNGTFAAVGGGYVAASSPDGLAWVQQDLKVSAVWNGIVFGGGRFVAVAGTGAGTAMGSSTSVDGLTWVGNNSLPLAQNWYTVGYGAGVFVAIALGSATCATSPDGSNWTVRTNALPSAAQWNSVTYGAGLFVAVNIDNATYATSPDGAVWTSRSFPNSGTRRCITYGSGLFVTLKQGTAEAHTSPDGLNWTQRDLTAAVGWRSVQARP